MSKIEDNEKDIMDRLNKQNKELIEEMNNAFEYSGDCGWMHWNCYAKTHKISIGNLSFERCADGHYTVMYKGMIVLSDKLNKLQIKRMQSLNKKSTCLPFFPKLTQTELDNEDFVSFVKGKAIEEVGA